MQNQGTSKFGIMIMSGFAALWFVWGLSALSSVPALVLLLPVVVSGTMIALAWRIPVTADEATRRRIGRVVGIASGIEGVAIFAAANVLNWTGHAGYFVCATAAIVGLHFLPLAHFFRVRNYYLAGAAMVALAAAGCAVSDEGTRLLAVGIGTAVLLWVTCLAAFGRKPGMLHVAA
jgi:hypothetical protein